MKLTAQTLQSLISIKKNAFNSPCSTTWQIPYWSNGANLCARQCRGTSISNAMHFSIQWDERLEHKMSKQHRSQPPTHTQPTPAPHNSHVTQQSRVRTTALSALRKRVGSSCAATNRISHRKYKVLLKMKCVGGVGMGTGREQVWKVYIHHRAVPRGTGSVIHSLFLVWYLKGEWMALRADRVWRLQAHRETTKQTVSWMIIKGWHETIFFENIYFNKEAWII